MLAGRLPVQFFVFPMRTFIIGLDCLEPTLVDRWLGITDEHSSVRFRYPAPNATVPETFFCAIGRDANRGDFGRCEPIAGTDALSAGIVTTSDVTHVNR